MLINEMETLKSNLQGRDEQSGVDTLGCAIFLEIDVPDRQVLILLGFWPTRGRHSGSP